METKKNVLTYAGLKKLEDELQFLKVEERKRIAEKIKEAVAQGDLSENAEYDSAKDEQRDIEARIEEITNILKNVEVVTEEDVESGIAGVGSHVKLLDMEYDEKFEVTIVGSTESSSRKGYISNESPLGKALIGQKRNKIVKVPTPTGEELRYKIISITKEDIE